MKKAITLPPEGMISLHVYSENLPFPIAIAAYNDRDEAYIQYGCKGRRHSSAEEICLWCINHGIRYQILYPLNVKQIIRNPLRYIAYKRLLCHLRDN